jgi:hypothetical protein
MSEYIKADPIRVHYEVSGPITKATIALPVKFADGAPGRLLSVGEARKHPKDRPEPGVGEALSLARALGSLAARLILISESALTGKMLTIDPRSERPNAVQQES